MNRRRLAVAIRLRQEFGKRIDRILPRAHWRGVESVRRHLSTDRRNAGAHDLLAKLLEEHRSNAGGTPPHATDGPPDRQQLLDHAAELLQGKWRVFEHPLQLASRMPAWRAHPLSGRQTPLDHFSSIHYTGEHLGGDVKYIWELNRHAELIRMAQAYFLTHDERFAVRTLSLLEHWIDDNPPNRGVNWVSALEIAFRSIAWCWIWKLTSKSPAWTPERFGKMLWTLSHAARYLASFDSIHHSPNTHLTGEGLGLLYIGSSFPMLRSAVRWKRRGIDILATEIPHQFLDDGFHYERSTGYHRYNVEFYLHALALARSTGESWAEAVVPHLERALDASLVMRKPDGDWPVFGDEDGGSTVRLTTGSTRNQSPLLVLGASLLGHSRWLRDHRAEDQSLAWWLDVAVPAANPEPQGAGHWSLPHAGYFGAIDRTNGAAVYCAVDAGPHGGDRTGHAHTDVGHIELAFGSDSIVADPGCAVYASDAVRRDWYRSLAAHACLIVNENPLAQPKGVFGWESISPTPTVSVRNDESMWACILRYPVNPEGLSHERQVLLIRGEGGGVLVVDRLLGGGTHPITWHWPLGIRLPHTKTQQGEQGEVTIGPITMSLHGKDLESAVRDSIRSRTYGSEEQVSLIEVVGRALHCPATIVTGFRRAGTPAFQIAEEGTQLRIVLPAVDSIIVSQAGALPERLRTSAFPPVLERA